MLPNKHNGHDIEVHIYTGSLHPRMTESLCSMLDGKASPKYAKDHCGKWYEDITAAKE